MSVVLSTSSASKLRTVERIANRVSVLQRKESFALHSKEKSAAKELRKRSLNFHEFRLENPTDREIAFRDHSMRLSEKMATSATFRDLLASLESDKYKNIRLSFYCYSELLKLVTAYMAELPISLFPRLSGIMNCQRVCLEESRMVSLGLVDRLKRGYSTFGVMDYTGSEWLSIGIVMNRYADSKNEAVKQLHTIIAKELCEKCGDSIVGESCLYLLGLKTLTREHANLFRMLHRKTLTILRECSHEISTRPIFLLHATNETSSRTPSQVADLVTIFLDAIERFPYRRSHLSPLVRDLDLFLETRAAKIDKVSVLKILSRVGRMGFAPLPISRRLIREFLREEKRLSLLSDEKVALLSEAIYFTGYRSKFELFRTRALVFSNCRNFKRLQTNIELIRNPHLLHRLTDEDIVRRMSGLPQKTLRPARRLIHAGIDRIRISRLCPESLLRLQYLFINMRNVSSSRRAELTRALAFHHPDTLSS